MINITYFVHGTTIDNENNIATGQLPGELSELGKKQMLELKNMIADKKFDAVFCSDLKRAIDSAELTFGNKYKIITDKRLRECNYGDYSGASDNFKDNMTDFIDRPFPNGESYKDVEKRLADFLQNISKKYNNKHIAIVAHQAPQLALEVLLNHKSWPEAISTDWRKTKSWQAGWVYKYS